MLGRMTRRALILSLLLAGCGSAEGPADGDNDNTAGGERAGPCREPDAPVALGLDGRWFLLEPNDEDVEVVFEISGSSGRAYEADPNEFIPMTVQPPGDDGLYRLSLVDPDDGEPMTVFMAMRGPGSAVAFATGEDELRIARREAPLPEWLEGAWVIEEPGDDRRIELEISGQQGTMDRGGERITLRLWGLTPEGATIDFIGQQPERQRGLIWLRLHRAGEGAWLLTEGDDDEFQVLHRPGAAPSWLAGMRPTRPPVDATTTAPPM